MHFRLARTTLTTAVVAGCLVSTVAAGVGPAPSLRLTAASGGTVAVATTGPRAAAAPTPAVPAGLPAAIEPLAAYVPADSCDPVAKAGTVELGELLEATYPGSSYGIDRTCGTDPLPTSEHYDGRAVDFFRTVRDPAQKAQIDALISWLFAPDAAGNRYANARRLGIMYLIWDNKIWGSYRAGEGWRAYSSCASHPGPAYDTTCHRDHLHISLSWEGAMGRTSFWSQQVAAPDYGPCRPVDLNWAPRYKTPNPTPCPVYPHVSAKAGASALNKTLTTYSGMWLAVGSTGPVVRAVQQEIGTTVDGSFGPQTKAALATWQTQHRLAASGVVDASTWRALLKATAAPSSPSPTAASSNPLSPYVHLVLRRGSRGSAVAALQRRLGVTADGWFGPRTQAAVKRFQVRHHLPVTGVVRARTWRVLGA